MTPEHRAVLWYTTDYRTMPPDLSALFDRPSYQKMVSAKEWLSVNGYMKFDPNHGWHLTATGRAALAVNRVRVVTRRLA